MARLVQSALADAGIEVQTIDHLESEAGYLSHVRRLVSECSAVIILLTRSTLNSQDVPFEIGMALAWERPVYLLYDGIDGNEIPAFLYAYHVRPLYDLPCIVREFSAFEDSTVD